MSSAQVSSFQISAPSRLRSRIDRQPKRLSLAHDFGCRFGVRFRRRNRSDPQQFLVAGNQIPFFVQISNDHFGGLVYRRTHRNRAQLPQQVVGQISRLRQEVLERRLLNLFHFARAAVARVQIILKERSEIDFLERILLLVRDCGPFFRMSP